MHQLAKLEMRQQPLHNTHTHTHATHITALKLGSIHVRDLGYAFCAGHVFKSVLTCSIVCEIWGSFHVALM